ncbi:MAG: hypothetical protein WC792_02380 [Candidatus Micrarchaeia archaeon]
MERALNRLGKKLARTRGAWMPAKMILFHQFLHPSERKRYAKLENTQGYFDPLKNKYLLVYHRHMLPNPPRIPLVRRLLIKKGLQHPIKIPESRIIPKREQERIQGLVGEMIHSARSTTGHIWDTKIEFKKDPKTNLVYLFVHMQPPKNEESLGKVFISPN